jgi:hypothetical protein
MVWRLRIMNWEGSDKDAIVAQIKLLSRHLPGGTEEIPENLSWDSRFPGQDLNSGPPEYEAAYSRYSLHPPIDPFELDHCKRGGAEESIRDS